MMIRSCVCVYDPVSEGFAKGMSQPKEFTAVNRADPFFLPYPPALYTFEIH